MYNITIEVTFVNSVEGQVNVTLLGKGLHYQYLVYCNESRNFDFPIGDYSIQIQGSSGGTVRLNIMHNHKTLLSRTCPPLNLFILDEFQV